MVVPHMGFSLDHSLDHSFPLPPPCVSYLYIYIYIHVTQVSSSCLIKMLTMTYHQVSMHDETMRKGPWLEEEDERLATFVELMGEKRWDSIARASGLRRSGKSCRLRWMNYLRPDLKHGQISFEEEHVILELHERWGNKWSKIARRLPGRTDNEIKNYWRTHLRKKSQAQEQEKVQRESDDVEMNTSDNNILAQESDLSSQTTSSDEYGSGKEDMTKTEHSDDVLGLPDLGFAMSPYENRLSDWISGSSNNCLASGNIVDSLRYPAWISGDGDDLWDYCSTSLWD